MGKSRKSGSMEADEQKMEKGEEFESKAFESMEKDFQEVLAELSGNDNLDYFRHEYEKLHRALKKSHGTRITNLILTLKVDLP